MMIKIIFHIFVFLWLSYSGIAQSLSDSVKEMSAYGTISIQSALTGVKVFIDTTFVGTTPIENFIILGGTHILKFVHPANDNWLNSAIVETVAIHPSDHLERAAVFSHRWTITSEPYGATVQHHDSIIGTTPLILSTTSEKYIIKISKDGFKDVMVPLSIDAGEFHMKLEPVEGSSKIQSPYLLTNKQSEVQTSVYVAAGAAVVSGVAAAFLKIESDRYYKDYRHTNSGSTLDKVRRLDIVSGISLAVSEISLFLLSYLLLSQ